MFDEIKFKRAVEDSGKSLQDIADLLGINLATLYRKMNGTSDFFRNEIYIICEELNLKDPIEIFFANKIAQT